MSGVFDVASQKINNLLEITSKGQATMANSFPVAIASNQFYDLNSVAAAAVDADPKTSGSLVFVNFHSMMLGSANGIAYGTDAEIRFALGAAGYTDFVLTLINGATTHDQAIRLQAFLAYDYGSQDARAFQANMPATNSIKFALTTAGGVGVGGLAGDVTAAGFDVYSVPALRYAPYVTLDLHASGAPTAGAWSRVILHRMR